MSELHIKMVQGLRSRFKIDQVTSVKGLKNELTFFSGSQLVKVITNALLNDREYQELQDEKRVTQIIILNCE